MPRLPRFRGLVAGMAAAVVLAGCGSETVASDAEEPDIVVTTSIWADVVESVACESDLTIEILIPVGGDPHRFEPSLADRARMDDARLIVANGLGLEASLVDTIAAAEDQGTPVFNFAEHVDTIPFATAGDDHAEHEDDEHDEHEDDEHDEHEDDEHDEHENETGHDEHDHEGDDPHVWFDPTRVATALPELGDQLVEHLALDADGVERCIDAYTSELEQVDTEIESMVATVPTEDRVLVTSHDALGYFADRYGFDIAGTVIPAPSGLAEANPAQLEELAELIEYTGVPAIFAETQHSTDDAEALAARVGDVEVVTLFTGTLDEEGGSAGTYVEFLRTNAQLIVGALS